jgi:hypothetical protein
VHLFAAYRLLIRYLLLPVPLSYADIRLKRHMPLCVNELLPVYAVVSVIVPRTVAHMVSGLLPVPATKCSLYSYHVQEKTIVFLRCNAMSACENTNWYTVNNSQFCIHSSGLNRYKIRKTNP